MTKLEKKIDRETKIAQRRGYYLYLLYQKGIYEILESYSKQSLNYVANALLIITDKEQSHGQLYNTRTLSHLRDILSHNLHKCALEMETYWSEKRKFFDLYGRFSASYLDRKASPPWAKSKVNLSKQLSNDGEHDPRKGHFKYYMTMIVDQIIIQIQRGALNEETPNQILKRVQALFNRTKKKGVREAYIPKYRQNLGEDLTASDDNLSLYGPVDIETGFYNADMLRLLKDEMIDANVLDFRQYSPAMSDELLANNKALYRLEQQLYSDYANLFHSGMADSVPDLKGIEDLEWTVDRPGVCPRCDARDGLTMAEIKEKVDDDLLDKVPSLHPNCKCQLEPRVDSSIWKKIDTEMKDVTWDPESGDLSIPKSVRDKYKLDMSIDEYINFLSQGGK